MVGIEGGDPAGDLGPPVPALGGVATVAQPVHEDDERPGDALATSHPRVRGGSENPWPGREGTTTWQASSARPPNAVGSVSRGMTSRNSTTDPGQPWVSSSGKASGWGDRTWRKWIDWPSITVRYCAN